MKYLKKMGWVVETVVHFNSWQPSDMDNLGKGNPRGADPTIFIDATIVNDWVQGLSEPLGENGEDIPGDANKIQQRLTFIRSNTLK